MESEAIKRYYGVAQNVAARYSIPGGDHDDCMQIALIAVLELIRKQPDPDPALVATAVSRRLIDELRRATGQRWKKEYAGPVLISQETPLDNGIFARQSPSSEQPEQIVMSIMAAVILLRPLPRYQREIALLRAQGYTQDEVGKFMGVTGVRISQIMREAAQAA